MAKLAMSDKHIMMAIHVAHHLLEVRLTCCAATANWLLLSTLKEIHKTEAQHVTVAQAP